MRAMLTHEVALMIIQLKFDFFCAVAAFLAWLDSLKSEPEVYFEAPVARGSRERLAAAAMPAQDRQPG